MNTNNNNNSSNNGGNVRTPVGGTAWWHSLEEDVFVGGQDNNDRAGDGDGEDDGAGGNAGNPVDAGEMVLEFRPVVAAGGRGRGRDGAGVDGVGGRDNNDRDGGDDDENVAAPVRAGLGVRDLVTVVDSSTADASDNVVDPSFLPAYIRHIVTTNTNLMQRVGDLTQRNGDLAQQNLDLTHRNEDLARQRDIWRQRAGGQPNNGRYQPFAGNVGLPAQLQQQQRTPDQQNEHLSLENNRLRQQNEHLRLDNTRLRRNVLVRGLSNYVQYEREITVHVPRPQHVRGLQEAIATFAEETNQRLTEEFQNVNLDRNEPANREE